MKSQYGALAVGARARRSRQAEETMLGATWVVSRSALVVCCSDLWWVLSGGEGASAGEGRRLAQSDELEGALSPLYEGGGGRRLDEVCNETKSNSSRVSSSVLHPDCSSGQSVAVFFELIIVLYMFLGLATSAQYSRRRWSASAR